MHARELLKREARKDPNLRVTGPLKVQNQEGVPVLKTGSKIMVGKTQFKVPLKPDTQAGEQITQKFGEVSKERKIVQMANKDAKMIGIIKIKDDQAQQKAVTRR